MSGTPQIAAAAPGQDRVPALPRKLARNRILLQLFEYWSAKCAGRAMPSRRDIDPAEMRTLLPHLQFVEMVDDGQRFRYGLTGTAIVEAYGRELTGRFVDEVLPPARRPIAERHYRLIFETRRPIVVQNGYVTEQGAQMIVDRLLVPLSNDGVTVNLVLMAQTFAFASRARGELGSAEAALAPVSDSVEIIHP